MSLEVRLAHRFGARDVAFAAPPGVTVLFGPSGSGKTTVIRAVAGLLRTDAGRIALDGRVLTDTDAGVFVPPHRRRLGVVFQAPRLFPHRSVRGNLLFGRAGARGFDRVVALLGVEALLDRRPAALSGGEAQRVAIGRALLADPAMLVMDEPLASLDAARKAEILPWLERLRDEAGVPILYVSHAAAEVARLATTLVLLRDGRVVGAGPVEAVLADPATALALGPEAAGAVLTARVAAQHADGLAELGIRAGRLWLPGIAAPVGAVLRIRIPAGDVLVARERPRAISALNILPAVVTGIAGDGASVAVGLDLAGDALVARLTRRSALALGLAPGVPCFAILKSVAIARGAGPDDAGF